MNNLQGSTKIQNLATMFFARLAILLGTVLSTPVLRRTLQLDHYGFEITSNVSTFRYCDPLELDVVSKFREKLVEDSDYKIIAQNFLKLESKLAETTLYLERFLNLCLLTFGEILEGIDLNNSLDPDYLSDIQQKLTTEYEFVDGLLPIVLQKMYSRYESSNSEDKKLAMIKIVAEKMQRIYRSFFILIFSGFSRLNSLIRLALISIHRSKPDENAVKEACIFAGSLKEFSESFRSAHRLEINY
ncbi:hypothetical protein O9G_000657 [Rozella allomycis CSF55]|uniref:Uncharacterized protein n=1 Tax=Rozella allomycis (strain CSF55) TaxID=988480 RepID=A0A075B2R3_ROZAC|nr:hypothetical protein O9G_000657 [Rozella allomycis CSF55]|eukprot:EPZ35261.1 hypothetical protein O9G_000657 [Rozella allomycis CSF55]